MLFTLDILITGTGLNVDRQLDLQVAYNTYLIAFIPQTCRGETGKGDQRAKRAVDDILIMTCCMKY